MNIPNMPIIKQLFFAYPSAAIAPEAILLYARLLADIPAADLQTVVDQAIAESKFLPTVAELRDLHRRLTGTIARQSSVEAWADVQQQIRRTGHSGAPKFDNELTRRVVAAMGWRNICMSETPGVDRAQFMRMYEQLADRADGLQKLLPGSRNLAERSLGGLQPLGVIIPQLTGTGD